MGLFGKYKQAEDAPTTPEPAPAVVGKGRPTPTRAEAEAARMAALHPTLTKREAAAQERAAQAARRQQSLAKAESAPERVLLRNYVDSRWSVLEFAWPVMLLVMVTLLLGGTYPVISLIGGAALYAFLGAGLINLVIAWRGFTAELRQRHPSAGTKGMLMMMLSRMMSPRRFRQPGAAISRGATY